MESLNRPSSPLSRRAFARLLGTGAAAAALRPALSQTAVTAVTATTPAASGVIRLNSNENPYGPSPAALAAVQDALPWVWQYPDDEVEELSAALASHHGLAANHTLLGPGSNEVLRLVATAFAGPGKKIVMADPTFEAIALYAQALGIEVVQVPLTADFRHDVPKMLAAAGTGSTASNTGLIYVCNPNNPTGSLTPKGELRALLAGTKGRAMVLVDEAYHHYAESPDYESAVPLVAEHPHLVVARTFSKIHALAGLRCGYAVARPDVIEKLWAHRAWDVSNLLALVAARASLGDPAYIERSRRLNRETRDLVTAEMERLGHRTIPSQTNFVMIDLCRESRPVIDGLRERGVRVGRIFPALPHHLRVSLGTREQIQTFLAAFRQVIA
jgi:histidinol-phosphate aminotransferase